MNESLAKLLNEAAGPVSPNRLQLHHIKDSLVRYLKRHQREVIEFPQLLGEPHWNVLVADFDLDFPSVFLAVLFVDETATFIAGHGESIAVRDFVDRDFPDNPMDLLPELEARFTLAQAPFNVCRDELNTWLNG